MSSVDVQGGTLRVRRNRSAWGGYPADRVGRPGRRDPDHPRPPKRRRWSDRAASTSTGPEAFESISRVSGSGRLNVAAVEADNLVVGLLGGGRITLAGRTKQLKATVQGSGDLAASGLGADDAQIASDTAGNVAVAVARTAKVTATGAGDVEIIGTPTCTVEAKGSGRVDCGTAR